MKNMLMLFCFFSLTAFAQNKDVSKVPLQEEGNEQMNGIAFKDYAGFENKYKLVTVRYRTDSGEQRFVFANDKAYKALQEGAKNYPDGAVFTKIGVATADDPAFLSSKVPSGTQRIQIMVRDQIKYKDTGGWGYALFSPRGRTFPNDPKSNVKACYACHKLVPERGEVFSQNFKLSTLWPVKNESMQPINGSRFSFDSYAVSKLPAYIQKLIKPSIKEISLLSGPLRDNVFQGTLDEIRPELMAEAVRSKRPALFSSLDEKKFTIIGIGESLVAAKEIQCSVNEKAFVSYWTMSPNKNGQLVLGSNVFCGKADKSVQVTH